MKTILVDAYNTLVTDKGFFQEMYIILEKFENPKIILTNADEEKQKELGLVDLPYPMFAGNFNPMKSESAFYEKFLSENNLQTTDVIYFEHSLEAVESARSLGIQTYHYNKDTKDLVALENFLKENI